VVPRLHGDARAEYGRVEGAPMAITTGQDIAWRHNYEDALKDAKAQRKLVLLDFSAAPT